MDRACCTCARLLRAVLPQYDEKTEKPLAQDRRLDCCGRVICGTCIAVCLFFLSYFYLNSPFADKWCWVRITPALQHTVSPFQLKSTPSPNTNTNTGPFCQISTTPSPLPHGLKDPPSYTPSTSTSNPNSLEPPSYNDDQLPAYSTLNKTLTPPEKFASQPAEDVLHFLDHSQDTILSLSLRYKVPIDILRQANKLTSDHLLLARRTVIIPGEYCKGGVSLSPRPVEGEEEERRKAIVRRWMVACKVAEYVPSSPSCFIKIKRERLMA